MEAYAAALRKVILDGRHAKGLARWGLSGEAVATSRVNPPDLPGTADRPRAPHPPRSVRTV